MLPEQSDSFGQTQPEIRFWNEPGLLIYDEWLSACPLLSLVTSFMVSSDQTWAVISRRIKSGVFNPVASAGSVECDH